MTWSRASPPLRNNLQLRSESKRSLKLCAALLRSDKEIPQPPSEPSIPPFLEKFDEEESAKRARLLYQSRKRGILENGLLLSSFADKFLDDFNEEELCLYDRLINLPSNDWEIYYWATGTKPTPEEFDNPIMDKLKEHARNEDRESRITQPSLKTKEQ